MIAVGMVQVTIHEIVDMIAMRHRFVSAIGAVYVCGLVTAAIVIGRAAFRVLRADFQDMLLD